MKAVLFDLDGVLVDSVRQWYHLMNAAARDWGYPEIPFEQIVANFGQGTSEDRRKFYPNHSIEDVDRYYNEHYLEHAQHVEINPDTREVLAELGRRGIRHAVITNTPRPSAEQILKAVDLKVELLIGGDEVPNAKPAPDMLLKALETLKIVKEEALMVGDSRFDREAARAAGVRFAGLGIEGDISLKRLSDLVAALDQPF